MLEFLAYLFNKGVTYGTLNSTRSAIALVVGDKISQDANMTRFFKGVYKLRPTKPKYNKVWDVQVVLDEFIKMNPLQKLNLSQLTEKTVTLLALVTAQRAQTISLIKINNIKATNTGYEIEIPDLIKTLRSGTAQPLLLVSNFDEDPLRRYLEVTEPLRGTFQELFISTTKAYRRVCTQSISRWIRNSLHKCGVDKEFTAHSTRHASTSAAAKKGASVAHIRKAAGAGRTHQKCLLKSIIDL